MAPEQIEGTTLGPSADLFAWAAVMVYAATGAPAFPGASQAARINRVLNRPPETRHLTDPLLSIVTACTAKDPAQRPTARQLREMLLTGQTTVPVPRTAPLDEPVGGEARAAEVDEEEASFLLAAGDRDPEAMAGPGTLLFERGEAGEAELWSRRAAETGDTSAIQELGALLFARSEVGEAEADSAG